MKYDVRRNIDLLRLILFVAIVTCLLTFASVFYASSQVQRDQLIEASLESNYNYAQKLASSTNDFLLAAQSQVATAAQEAAPFYDDPLFLIGEAERLRTQSLSFNSVIFVDKHAKILATSPSNLDLMGSVTGTTGVQNALKERQPQISAPTLSSVGNLVIFISHPVYSANGDYLGLVGGTLYLRQTSALNRLLGEHYYNDGSYIYVVTKDKQLIYYPTDVQVGDIITDNNVVDAVTLGRSGKQAVLNHHGVDMLAGYGVVPTTGWGVVVQSPLSAVIAPLKILMQEVMYRTVPLALLVFILVWWCARRVAAPLQSLAENARCMASSDTEGKIRRVKSWYFEAYELKKALLLGMELFNSNIEKLNKDVNTDPLTGLHNRRSLESKLLYYENKNIYFSLISLDIDHFKHVNDTYGHDVGDLVLKELARLMLESCRNSDLACRLGGEEFLILLPGINKNGAALIAERLRKAVELTPMPFDGYITVSLGVSSWPRDTESIAAVLKLADDMLYKAKREGRNRIEVSST